MDSVRTRRHPARMVPRRFALLTIVAVLLGVVHVEIRADEDAPPEKPGLEARVVVTANRNETPIDEVGSAVTVLTAEDLERAGQWLVVDALRQVPGLDVRRNGGPGTGASLFLRGADSDHTVVLLDGIELNDPSTPSRTAVADHLVVDALERVEVLRGPQSTLYGSDAIGGVVQLFTRRSGGEGRRSSIWGEGGSFGTHRAGFTTSGGDGSLDYFVGISRLDSDGFSASSSGTEDDPYRNTSFTGRVSVGAEASSGVDVIVHHVDSRVDFDGFASEGGNRIDARQTLARIQPRYSTKDGRWHARFAVEAARHDRTTMSAFSSEAEGETFGIDWQADRVLGSRHRLTFGLDGEWEQARLTGFDDSARTVGAYVQDHLGGRRWFGTFGARFDDHSRFGGRTTVRFSGGRRLGRDRTILRASLGTGFKAPAIAELNDAAFGGNPSLDAETTRGFDIGVDRYLNEGRLRLGLTLFSQHIDDLIQYGFDSAAGIFRNFNVDEARSEGVEFECSFDPSGPVGLRASYTFNDTEALGSNPQGYLLRPGDRLLRRPQSKGAVAVSYALPAERGSLQMSAAYVGNRRDIDPVTFGAAAAESYILVNAAIGFDVTDRLTVTARLDNLFDEQYEDVLGFGTAGLSGYGGVRYRF